MTPEQEAHLESIKERFSHNVDSKYRNGQREHGGDMWRMSAFRLLDNAIDEALDQVVYLLTLRDKLVAAEQNEELDGLDYLLEWGDRPAILPFGENTE